MAVNEVVLDAIFCFSTNSIQSLRDQPAASYMKTVTVEDDATFDLTRFRYNSRYSKKF